MVIKDKTGDFRVTENLVDGFVGRSGPHRVYRVQKRKLTSIEAAAALAELVQVTPADVSMAGLKDRQGVTIQYMSVEGGRPATLSTPALKIEAVGKSQCALTSEHSTGNSFEVRVRDLSSKEVERLREAATRANRCGVPNYFDEQRFGNLKHGQGWVARELMMGRREEGLKRLVASTSTYDDDRTKRFKRALRESWRDWRACRSIAGKLGQYHSVFEHLIKNPRDYPGAFRRVATRIRLIHLFAFQSHLWNRAVYEYLHENFPRYSIADVDGIEGALAFPLEEFDPHEHAPDGFRLPGPRFKDVADKTQKRLFARVLRAHGLTPHKFEIPDIPGFGVKGEDRALWIHPRIANPRPAPARGAASGPERYSVKLRFDLPRGAYATVVVKRLLARRRKESTKQKRSKRS